MVLMGWLLESGVDGAGSDSTNVSSVYNDLLASLEWWMKQEDQSQ